ncbi:unnamed protein product [Soboliphyme baturini]|uniref:Mediator of RNA polymerase II transcription subunit 15 n=1 Tax=Soboliphyme baturini TaxID=241478 RepID=A0A183IPG1_9BILA|nr:unnamed protein product [Soboliphyme baturini]
MHVVIYFLSEPSPTSSVVDPNIAENPAYKEKIRELQVYLETLKKLMDQHQKDGAGSSLFTGEPFFSGSEAVQEACESDENNDQVKVPMNVQREVAFLTSRFKIALEGPEKSKSHTPTILSILCWLEDPSLPFLPPLRLFVPIDYPHSNPKLDMCSANYGEFVQLIHHMLRDICSRNIRNLKPGHMLEKIIGKPVFRS